MKVGKLWNHIRRTEFYEWNFWNVTCKLYMLDMCILTGSALQKKGGVVLNIVPYVWTVRARAFVFQICNPCEKNFYWTRRTLTLWPRPWRTHVYILTFFSVSFLWQLWATHYNYFKSKNHFDTLQGINIESFKTIAWVVIEKIEIKEF